MPQVTLPDGSVRSFDKPVTVADVAADIGPGLAKSALAGRVNGQLVDTAYLIEEDADIAIITGRDDEGLEIIRHSTAHLLAHAVNELFPDAQVTIGPVTDDGFYYDFAYKRSFTEDDLRAIEKRMDEIAKRDLPVNRKTMLRDEAIEYFRQQGEEYRPRLLRAFLRTRPCHYMSRVNLPTFVVARMFQAHPNCKRSS